MDYAKIHTRVVETELGPDFGDPIQSRFEAMTCVCSEYLRAGKAKTRGEPSSVLTMSIKVLKHIGLRQEIYAAHQYTRHDNNPSAAEIRVPRWCVYWTSSLSVRSVLRLVRMIRILRRS